MFLTRVDLNGARRAGRLLSSPRRVHGAVMAGFPEPPRGRVLWRLDHYGQRAALYVVSPDQPDFRHLIEQVGWPTLHDTWRTVDYRSFLDRLSRDDIFRFRLEANPAHSASRGPGLRGKRFGHVTVAQQAGWLLERADRIGVRLGDADAPTFQVVGRDVKSFKRDGHVVTLATAVFEGTLVVEDAERLRDALVQGIGRGKAYGCGLLTLARIS